MVKKKLVFCDDIKKGEKYVASDYCAPIFIANSSFGVSISKDIDLVFEEITEDSVRSGTLTFISYKGQALALTCGHVVAALRKKREESRRAMLEKYGEDFNQVSLHFYTPIGLDQFHFNYELTPVPIDPDGTETDLAIARIDRSVITRLGRTPLIFTDKKNLPKSGLAGGYPEQQRTITNQGLLGTLSPKFVACIAELQITGNGDLMLQDEIAESNGVDNLSGMSGGPILWSDSKRYGLAGIVYEGLDIQGGKERLVPGSGILIRGVQLTSKKLDKWLLGIPHSSRVEDQSKRLHVPPAAHN